MKKYVVLDIETTGTQPTKNDIIEIGAVYIEDDRVVERFDTLICPKEAISAYITSIAGITEEMVKDAPTIEEIMPKFLAFCKGATLIGHNITLFDYRMLKVKADSCHLPFQYDVVDTLIIARKMLADLPSRRLGALCEHYGISLENAHRAYDDAYATYELFLKLKEAYSEVEPTLFFPTKVEWQAPKTSPITEKQKKYLLNLCEMHTITLETPINTLTKSEASRRIDKIISEYGNRR